MTDVEVPGVLTAAQVRETAEHIAGQQQDDGLIPWFTGHHGDPWDHVEAAMALVTAGLQREAERAYEWSARTQRADGSWPMEIVGSEVRHASADANQCAYVAVGIWQHWLVTRNRRVLDTYWPVVRAAIEFVIDLQRVDGAVHWSRDAEGIANPEALLTGSACIVLSLRAALAIAEVVGDPQPEWELAAARLAHSVAAHPERFADKSRYSMDWYYPVLGGAVTGAAARAQLRNRWEEFVHPGRGIRCVADQPWITAAETCELVIALDAARQRAQARQLFTDVQFLRADDGGAGLVGAAASGGYWTGWVSPKDVHWPAEQTTWTAAAVILAADVLAEATPAHGLFRGTGLAALLPITCDDECGALV
jgi:hypothetical protein